MTEDRMMKETNNKQSVYEEPELLIIYLTEADIITTSGDPYYDDPEYEAEGERIM